MDRFDRGLSLPLRVDGEVHHHDSVFLHQANEHDHADERIQIQIDVKDHQGEQRAEAGGGQAGQDRQWVRKTRRARPARCR